MTNPDFTQLLVIVDRSGSMYSIQQDAEGGVKALIEEQKSLPGKLKISLFEFDDEINEVPEVEIDNWHLNPRGATALLDAMGKAVTVTGERLAALDEDERPGTVLVIVTTDGLENSSMDWTRDRIADLIKRQREEYNWKFVFSAANQDAISAATSYGFAANSAMNFASAGPSASASTRSSYSTASAAFSSFRSGLTKDVSVPDQV